MATKTFEELKQLAIQIRDEKTNKQNTATRVGTAMLEHINKLEQDYYDKTQTDEELKEQNEKLTGLEKNKQDKLQFDETPTLNSENPVKSNGIRIALDEQKNEVVNAKNEALDAIDKNEQEAISNFKKQRVTPEMLSESTKQYIEASGGGTITNLADDEDITSKVNYLGISVLKFADRGYNPTNFIGKGYKIIRKNIVEGKNILTQDMINETNTIYEIKYTFDLNNENITIPEDSVLKFNGGIIENGTIIYNKTFIIGFNKSYNNIIASGTLTNSIVFSDWFCPKKDGITDDFIALQNFLNCGKKTLVFNTGNYLLSKGLSVPATTDIDAQWSTFILKEGVTGFKYESLDNTMYVIDTVLRNIVIQSSEDNVIGIQFGRGVYFNYLYNFDIRINGSNSIGIVETSNFNTIIRDGRIIGRIGDYQENSIGMKFTTGIDELVNNQVTNLLTDSVLIQGFDIGVSLEYGTTAHDTIQFNNIGFSVCNYGYYFKSGYTNVAITNQRIENSNLLLKVQKCRGLSLRDLYILNTGFLELSEGKVVAFGYLWCIKIGNGTDAKRFLKIDGGILTWNVGSFDNWGYGLSDEVVENSITYNGMKYNSISDALNIIGTVYKKDNLFVGKINSNTEKALRYLEDINKKEAWNPDYSTLSINILSNIYAIQGNITLINGGYDGQIVKIVSGDGLQHSILINDIYYSVSQKQHITIQKVDNVWVLYSDIPVKQIFSDSYPNEMGNGTIIGFKENYSNQYGIQMKIGTNKWVDANGYTFGLKYGITDRRPSVLTEQDKGKTYFDTDLGKQIIWDGSKWIYPNGIIASAKFTGNFSQKPTSEQNIPIGFAYFCTDKQTYEGSTNGIMIYYKGNNVWVDALGRVVE